MSEKRINHTVTLLSDDRVLVTGGGKEDGPYSQTLEIYDASADTWVEAAPMTVCLQNTSQKYRALGFQHSAASPPRSQ